MPSSHPSPPTSRGHRARLAFALQSARARFERELTTETAEELRLAAGALVADILVEESR